MIVYDPSPEADATRGTTCDRLVEQIDLAPTFVEVAGGTVPDHILEGRSLLRGEQVAWRAAAIREYDYAMSETAATLGMEPLDCRLLMVATQRWKFMHAEGGFRPMLFDLETDPEELTDLGAAPEYREIVDDMYDLAFAWARRMAQRTTISEAEIKSRMGRSARRGILLGVYDEADTRPDLMEKYQGAAPSTGGTSQRAVSG